MILSDLSERLGGPVLSISRRLGGRSRRGDRSRTIADHLGDPRREPLNLYFPNSLQPNSLKSCQCPPRNPGRRSDSKLDTATRFAVLFGLFQHFIQATGRCITLDLTVPLVRDELLKPSGEDGKLLGRELRHSVLDFLNAHVPTLRLDCHEIKVNRVFQPHLATFQRFPVALC